jgi:hypothetical protein
LTNFAGTNSLVNFHDPAATNSSRRFYRTARTRYAALHLAAWGDRAATSRPIVTPKSVANSQAPVKVESLLRALTGLFGTGDQIAGEDHRFAGNPKPLPKQWLERQKTKGPTVENSERSGWSEIPGNNAKHRLSIELGVTCIEVLRMPLQILGPQRST